MSETRDSVSETLESVVIGAGPIGIEVAIELQRRGLRAQVFDAGPIGHTISWWAPCTRWFSSNDRIAIAGVPLNTVDQAKASREEYLNYLRGVIDQYQVPVTTFSRLVSITENSGDARDGAAMLSSWKLRLRRVDARLTSGFLRERSAENSANDLGDADFFVNARSVVLAIGGTDVPNRLGIAGENLPHVDGYLREVHRYHGRRVLIVGGRNSAVEAAIRLHRGGARVSLCYHGERLPEDGIKYWLRPEIEGLIRSGSIEKFFASRVVEITNSAARIETTGRDNSIASQVVPFDDVLTLIGYRQDKTLFSELGILSDSPSGAPVYDPETMQTSRGGIYVAGTAIGGTQSSKYQVFLENCHDHAGKIADHLCRSIDPTMVERGQRSGDRRDQGLEQRIVWQPES